jgi:hypothetical protein
VKKRISHLKFSYNKTSVIHIEHQTLCASLSWLNRFRGVFLTFNSLSLSSVSILSVNDLGKLLLTKPICSSFSNWTLDSL